MREKPWVTVLAWVLWSKLSVVGGATGWQQPVVTWESVTGTTTEGQCRELQRRAAERAQGSVPRR